MRIVLNLVAFGLFLVSPALSTTLPDFSFHWNRFIQLESVNEHIVALSEHGIAVLEYDPANDTYHQNETLLIDGRPAKIKAYGDSLLVLTYDNQIQIVNFSNAPELSLVGSVEPQTEFYDFTLYGESLYLACGFDGIQRVSSATDSDGKVIDYSRKGTLVTQVEVADNRLVALDQYNGLMTYDLSNSGFGSFADYLYLDHRASRFRQLNDSSLIILNQTAHALIADRQEDHLTISGAIQISAQPLSTFETDDRVILVSARMIESYSKPGYSLLGSAVLANNRVEGALVNDGGGDALIFPDLDGGLTRYDLDDLSVTKQVLDQPGRIRALAATSKSLASTADSDTLQFYDVSQSERPRRETWYRYPVGTISTLTANGDSVMALYTNGQLMIIKVRDNPESTSLTKRELEDVGSIKELKYVGPINGRGNYLAARKVSDVTLYDLTLGPGPIDGTRFEFTENVSDFAVHDTLLAIAHGYSVELFAADSDLTLTSLTTRVFSTPTSRLVLFDKRMITIDGNHVMLWDIDDPTRPFRLSETEIDQSIADVELVDDYLLAVGPGGAYAIDLSGDQLSVEQVGSLPATMLAWVDGLLFTSDGSSIHQYQLDLKSGPNSIVPETYALYQNFPNPFNPSTSIQFDLPRTSKVSLVVYNSLGQQVRTLLNGSLETGRHTIGWDGTDASGEPVASGVYFYRVVAGERQSTRKMILLK